ncbi:MAG: pentapeptide repeat-containing protein, partial [Methyloceanibacter sp.]
MASHSKRGRLVRPATYRSCTDMSADWAEAPDAKDVSSHAAPAGASAQAACDGAVLASGGREDGDFRYARLDQAAFAAADLSDSSFDHAHLAGADLTEANLSGASFRFATAPVAGFAAADLSRADLQLSRLDQANLRAANLSGAMLDHGDFAGACLAEANLKNASLRFAKLIGADLAGADLASADLRYARLSEACLAKVNLRGALLDYADFHGTDLADANLLGAHLRYAKNLTPAQILRARIDDSTILPLHYFEPKPPRPAGRALRWKRPLLAAGLFFVGLMGSWAALGLVSHLDYPADQTRLLIALAPPVTPTLATPAPPVLAPATPAEAPEIAGRPLPLPLASPRSYPTFIVRNSSALTSATRPAAAQPASPQRVRLSAVAPVLLPPVPETARTLDAALEGTERDVATERLILATTGAGDFLEDAPSRFVAAVPATLTLRVRERPEKAPAAPAPDIVDPLMLVVSLDRQQLDIYRGTELVTSSKISSGKPGHDTRPGVFSIIEKRRYHHSNLYSGAPMPWMQRMTWSGTALHAGVVPGYPASHGCVRLPFSFAPKLFKMTNVGENVVVAQGKVVPKPLDHPNLFQPASAEPQVSLALATQGELATDAATVQLQDQEQSGADAASDETPGAPLRILITRRTERDRIIAVQYLLASLGHLKPQNFTGRIGAETIAAIKAFQKANGLRATGAYTSDLVKEVYLAAGKAEPPPGHL